jgi:hypothetical protein
LLDTLAAAYAEVGRYDQAMEIARKALVLADRNKRDLARQIQGRLINYEHKRPITRE